MSHHGHDLRSAVLPAGRDGHTGDRTPGRHADHDRGETKGARESLESSSFVYAVRFSSGRFAADGRLSLRARGGQKQCRKDETHAREPGHDDGIRPNHRGISSCQVRTLSVALGHSLHRDRTGSPNSLMRLSPRLIRQSGTIFGVSLPKSLSRMSMRQSGSKQKMATNV